MEFDPTVTFGDDYLYFYVESIDDGHSDDDTAQILGLLELPAGARLLDAPCGHGRISRRLAAIGMQVTGIDLSAHFIEMAQSAPTPTGAGGYASYFQGDLRQLPAAVTESGPFDAVICWYSSFGYWDDDNCRLVLSSFRRVLRPGGTLLIETMHHDGAVRHFTPAPDATVLLRGDDSLVDLSHFDVLTGRLVTERTVHRAGAVRRSTHFVRLPTPPEWIAWLEGAGFTDVSFSSGEGEPLDVDSWVVIVKAVAA
jgi:SAM-dependent methyltransferase